MFVVSQEKAAGMFILFVVILNRDPDSEDDPPFIIELLLGVSQDDSTLLFNNFFPDSSCFSNDFCSKLEMVFRSSVETFFRSTVEIFLDSKVLREGFVVDVVFVILSVVVFGLNLEFRSETFRVVLISGLLDNGVSNRAFRAETVTFP